MKIYEAKKNWGAVSKTIRRCHIRLRGNQISPNAMETSQILRPSLETQVSHILAVELNLVLESNLLRTPLRKLKTLKTNLRRIKLICV